MRLAANEARRRFAEAEVATLATVRPDGRPHLVPVVFSADGDVIVLVVDPKPKASADLQRLRNIAANPAVSLLVDHYESDWSRLWWVRADGNARVVSSGAERDEAIRLLEEKYPQYGTLTGEFGPAVIVRVRRWTGWSYAFVTGRDYS